MQAEIQKLGEFERELSVSIPSEEVDAALKKAFKEVRNKASIPGFRPGKVPMGMLESRFGDQVHYDVSRELIDDHLKRAIREHDLFVLGSPAVDANKCEKGSALDFSAKMTIQPRPAKINYEGLKIIREHRAVTDADIDAELTGLRKRAEQVVPITDRDVVQKGDMVLIDYVGSIDGTPFEGGTAENSLIEAGGEGYIPGFTESLAGAKVPSEMDINVPFPADYNKAELAGKDAVFTFKLKEIKAKELPELDDDFAQDMGYDSIQALRDKVGAGIAERFAEESAQTARDAAVKSLVAANDFNVSPQLIENQLDATMEQMQQQMQMAMSQMGQMAEDMVMPQERLDEMREKGRPEAEDKVRAGLLLQAVQKLTGVSPDPNAAFAEVERIAANAGEHAEMVRRHYMTPEGMSEVFGRMSEKMALDKIVELADVQTVEIAAGEDSTAPVDPASSDETNG